MDQPVSSEFAEGWEIYGKTMTGIVTSENSFPRGKSSSEGWSGLTAFYHILLYIGDRFFVQLLDSFPRWTMEFSAFPRRYFPIGGCVFFSHGPTALLSRFNRRRIFHPRPQRLNTLRNHDDQNPSDTRIRSKIFTNSPEQ